MINIDDYIESIKIDIDGIKHYSKDLSSFIINVLFNIKGNRIIFSEVKNQNGLTHYMFEIWVYDKSEDILSGYEVVIFYNKIKINPEMQNFMDDEFISFLEINFHKMKRNCMIDKLLDI